MVNYYGLSEIQDDLMEIVDDIDKVCRKNGIKYSLYAGTLIGAIRHKGFIPWDDDIDLVFERKEYEKFLRVYPDKKGNKFWIDDTFWVYKIRRCDREKADNDIGCFVDLLVFDNVPTGIAKSRFKNFLIKVLQGTLKRNVDYQNYSFYEKIMILGTQIVGMFFTRRWKLKKYNFISKIGNKEEAKKIRVYNGPFVWLKHSLPKAVVNEYIDVIFEGKKMMALKASDQVLRSLYGDYMTLPPVEERVPKHLDIL